MKTLKFYNQKCKKLGYDDFEDWLNTSPYEQQSEMIIQWTEEYAKLAVREEIRDGFNE